MDEALFKKVPIKVQKKSGFDLSFQNLLTTKVGTITPVLCEELIPNETVHLKAAIQAQLPPLASDTFMRCDLKYEAFFVPTRLIFKGFEEWLMPTSNSNNTSPQTTPKVPLLKLHIDDVQRGSLADYLGFKSNLYTGATGYTNWSCDVNALPFLGYHRIYDDWYRNSLVQKPIYRGKDGQFGSYYYTPSSSDGVYPCSSRGYVMDTTLSGNVNGGSDYMDGIKVSELRQRNFGIDYFTSATPQAQNGDEQGLRMTVDAANTASFTINQLRNANAIQQWLERNNLAGNRLVDYVKANYGANLSDGVAQRAILLGSGQFAVYSKGIFQSSNTEADNVGGAQNPFNSDVAAQYGAAMAAGSETIIDSFTAQEPGYLYVLCTLVPKVTYATGVDRKLLRYVTNDRSDMANPMLQGTGNQPIWTTELISDVAQNGLRSSIFGFTERYAEWKSKNDELHGLLRENRDDIDSGGTLQSFALQSSFIGGDSPQISTDFLKIPTSYLDNVAATKGNISKYGCWIDSYFDFKVSMPLARYSMPTLQDPAYEHGEDLVIDRGGKRL